MSTPVLNNLNIRAGSAADIAAVREICAEVWGGTDYVPEVWPEWIADPKHQVYVFELDERPVAFYYLERDGSGPGTVWIGGVRVWSAYRGRGLAAAILEHAIATSRAQGFQFARYMTAQQNTPMHRLAERFGFRLVNQYLGGNYGGGQSIEQPVDQPVDPIAFIQNVTLNEMDAAYRLITASAEYKASEGLYTLYWHAKPLTAEALREHIEQGEVWKLAGPLEALAIADRDYSLWLGFLVGSPASQLTLVSGLTALIDRQAPTAEKIELETMLVNTPQNETLLQKTGFTPYEDEPVMCLYEFKLR